MNVADQLMMLRARLRQTGWVRLNGNTWQSPDKTYTLHTAYTHGEATLELDRGGVSGKYVHDLQLTQGMTKSAPARYYRGAEPLIWAETEATPVLRKIFAKQLDTEPA